MKTFEVKETAAGCQARRAVLRTAHGDVTTPVFMPIATRGAVKGVTHRQLSQTGASIVLANTYHLMLRPGVEVVESLGGLGRFMAWAGPILTDSGGYQVFSLKGLRTVTDEGVEFASHIDGRRIFLDAEIVTRAQNRLGADIIMCFDEPAALPCSRGVLEKALERTVKWARICRETHANEKQLLFGIVQGGVDLDLRSRCVDELVGLDFDGYALGGLSVGEGWEDMIRTVRHTARLLPADKPRYLMGVGTPADIIGAVRAGVDMFDCVLPTRNGRNAFAFTRSGRLRLRNSSHISDDKPVEEGCDCYCCRTYTRATIRHFFNVGEMLGPILLSLHNLRFYQRLMYKIRETLKQGCFEEWAGAEIEHYRSLGEADDTL